MQAEPALAPFWRSTSFSGRTTNFTGPGATDLPRVGTVVSIPPAAVTRTWPWAADSVAVPLKKLAAPTKPATNSVAGYSNTALEASHCSTFPPFITATRSDIVIASS